MAEPDCAVCEALGYRTCDSCGGVVIPPTSDPDVCHYCASSSPAAHGRSGST